MRDMPSGSYNSLYHRLVKKFDEGNEKGYLEELKDSLNIRDEEKKDKLAKTVLKLHKKIVKKHSEYVKENYGIEDRKHIHETIKPLIDHIEMLNRENPEVLESEFLHKPVWGKKSILDILASRVNKTPQTEYLRFVHFTGTLVNHYDI